MYDLAHKGHLVKALDKCNYLINDFPEEAGIINEKGNLYSKYLGCGKRAYECYSQAVEINGNHQYALINSTDYAPTEGDFRRRSSVALKRVFDQKFTMRIKEILRRLDKGA